MRVQLYGPEMVSPKIQYPLINRWFSTKGHQLTLDVSRLSYKGFGWNAYASTRVAGVVAKAYVTSN